jgi:hypothetical protein
LYWQDPTPTSSSQSQGRIDGTEIGIGYKRVSGGNYGLRLKPNKESGRKSEEKKQHIQPLSRNEFYPHLWVFCNICHHCLKEQGAVRVIKV